MSRFERLGRWCARHSWFVVGAWIALVALSVPFALQAPSVVIESRSGTIDLGDGLSDPGFTGMAVSNASFNAIKADAITFYAGYFGADRLTNLGPSSGSIKVGTLSWNTRLEDGSTNRA